ncbi:putative betaine--homocysteine S-methyltransferase 1 [Apostichopus japonicus]|uniref:Putative betaine--homocysteine S-methyltransferase 1 n=1 Tax=Stichopus japonicus TaxID=307972 RepID=A0A2G8LD08_STIJA|nr:putative betaine--homocysteine S-methyltransferase 1 [Apostichopus japonicus]
MKTMHLPIACSMRVGPAGDLSGVTPQECAIRMAQAGADVVGVNCNYDPFISLETLEMMKIALKEAGYDVYLMVQPVGWHTQEIRDDERGYTVLPEFPYGQSSRSDICIGLKCSKWPRIGKFFPPLFIHINCCIIFWAMAVRRWIQGDEGAVKLTNRRADFRLVAKGCWF